MAHHWRISIRSKILLVLSAVVIAAVALYLYLASRIFFEDKTLLIYELNQTNVRTLAAESEAQLSRISDLLRLTGEVGWNSTLFSSEDRGILRVGTLTKDVSGQVGVKILGNAVQPLHLFSKDESWLNETRKAYPIPFERVLQEGMWVKNVTLPGGDSPPIMTLAIRLQADRVAFADVMLDRLGGAFERRGIAQSYMADSEGFALAHSDPETVRRVASLSSDPLIRAALQSKVRSELKRLGDGEEAVLGSFYRLASGRVIVASRVAEREAFSAARVLVQRSLLYALVVITAAFLVSLFFSHSITAPILRLVEGTRRIAQGDFSREVPVTSRDELAILAQSFNSMIGDLRDSRAQIEEYSRGLEMKVAERTAKLEAQNIAIHEAQEALVRTTRLASVGEIAGRAAHEVLNPLTNISTRLEKIQTQRVPQGESDFQLMGEIVAGWTSELAKQGTDGLWQALLAPSGTTPGKSLLEEDLENLDSIFRDGKARLGTEREDLAFLMRESGRINKIVNGMRSLTRMSGQRKRLEISAFLDEAIRTFSDLFHKSGFGIEKVLPGGSDLALMADPDELLQVVGNLIRNSLQAFEAARSQVDADFQFRLRIEAIAQSGRIEIRVMDNGPGVAPEDAARIFDPSFTTKSPEDGTGLGLSICRRFVRAWGGEVVLESSSPFKTTVFKIDLPEVTS